MFIAPEPDRTPKAQMTSREVHHQSEVKCQQVKICQSCDKCNSITKASAKDGAQPLSPD
jgi:hypothetical protein